MSQVFLQTPKALYKRLKSSYKCLKCNINSDFDSHKLNLLGLLCSYQPTAHYNSLVSHLSPALLAIIISPALPESQNVVFLVAYFVFGSHFSDVFSLHKRYIKITL